MSRLTPDLSLGSVYELSPRRLRERGIRLLLLDLDNTLAPYHIQEAEPRLREWIAGLKAAGVEPFILSNNRGSRPARFAGQLGVGYVGRAKKPGTRVLKRVLAEKGVAPAAAALVGDQIYTDVLCAGRAGILSVLVKPLCLRRNPLLALRYGAEAPFRLAARGRK